MKFAEFSAQGWAVNCLGHSPAIIVDALAEQSRKLIAQSPRVSESQTQ